MKKRVLIFSLVYLPKFVGGAEVAVHEITKRLDDVEFDMVTLRMDPRLEKEERVGRVTVHRIGLSAPIDGVGNLPLKLTLMKFLFPVIGLVEALKLHKRNQYSAIWSIMASYNAFAALFFKLIHPKVPFLLTLQEGDPLDYIKKKVALVYPLFKMIFTKADLVQTISEYLADFAREMEVSAPVVVVPNAVDVSLFSQNFTDADLFDLKDQLGKKYTDTYLITTGRLVVKNGVGDIIKSLTHLKSEVKLLILGAGFLEGELKRLAVDIGVSDRVRFLGHIEHSDLPKYLHVSDIFIRPSLSEGFGNSFIEAMAARIPVVATPVGGIPDFLVDRKTGVFCKPKDPQSIAKAVELLMGNDGLRRSITDEAFDMVSSRYDWSTIATEMKTEVFEKILK